MNNIIDVFELKKWIDLKDKNLILICVLDDSSINVIPNSYIVWRPDYMGENAVESVGKEVQSFRKPKEEMEVLLSKCGVTDESKIVIYSYNNMHDSARFWWQVSLLGNKNIKYLDGGLNAWLKEIYPVSKGSLLKEENIKTNYKARCYDTDKIDANIEQVIEALENKKDWIVIDTRTKEEYLGKMTLSSKNAFGTGRIKGAVHIEWSESLVANTNMLKSKEELNKIYENIKDKKIIVTCQSGVRAAHMYFILKEVLELENVYNYDGSWIEWSYVASEKSKGAVSESLRNKVLSLTEDWTDNKEII